MSKSRTQIAAEILANLPDNTTGLITPAVMRTTLQDMADAASNLADYAPAAPVSGVINVNKPVSGISIAIDSAFTFSAVPQSGSIWSLLISNIDVATHEITIPSSWSLGLGSLRTSFTLFAGATVRVTWYYDGSVYYMAGEPVLITDLPLIAAVNPSQNKGIVYVGGVPKQILLKDMIPYGPITLSSGPMNVSAASSGDIGAIAIPSWITKWKILHGATSAAAAGCGLLANAASGTLAALQLSLFTGPTGSGTSIIAMGSAASALTAANTYNVLAGLLGPNVYTAPGMFINITAPPANVGQVTAYVTILPLF